MAVDIAAMSTPTHHRRLSDIGRTTSLPASAHPLLGIPQDLLSSFHPHSPSSSSSSAQASASAFAAHGGSSKCSIQWREGPPIASESGTTPSAKVRSALDCASGRILAVKSVASNSLPRDTRQLEQEQCALERLRGCSNVVQLLASHCTDGTESPDGAASSSVRTRSLLLEYVSGGSVADVMARFGGALPERVAQRYARGILQGLANVHAMGLVHCDVRARNVLVSSATGQPKICSFGLSMREGEAAERVARKQRLQGSYQWMAPEVIRQEDQSQASDIWSFGCTLLEMLSGCPPWTGQVEGSSSSALADFIGRSQNLPAIPGQLSPDCARLLQRCLQRSPAGRPTAQELLLDPFLEASSPTTTQQQSGSSGQRSASNRSGSALQPIPPSRAVGAWPAPVEKPTGGIMRSQSAVIKEGVPMTGNSMSGSIGIPMSASMDRFCSLPSPGGAPVERPRSPDGHDGICKQTLQKATIARQQSGNVSGSVQIWQREDDEAAPAAAKGSLAPSASLSAVAARVGEETASGKAGRGFPASATVAASSSAEIWRREDDELGGGSAGAAGNAAPPSIQIWQRDVNPLERTTSLQSPGQAPNLPPAVVQMLTSPNGVRMGPLMRQISRDAHEFSRLQATGGGGGPEAQGGAPTIQASRASPNGFAPNNPTMISPIRSIPSLPRPGDKPRLDVSSSNVFAPLAPLSPRANSPHAPSPRKAHRRSGSVASPMDASPLNHGASPLNHHRRSGSVAADSTLSLGAGASGQAGGIPPTAGTGVPPMAHRRSGSVHFDPGAGGSSGGAHRRSGSMAVDGNSSHYHGNNSPYSGSPLQGSSPKGGLQEPGGHRRSGSVQVESGGGVSGGWGGGGGGIHRRSSLDAGEGSGSPRVRASPRGGGSGRGVGSVEDGGQLQGEATQVLV